MSNLLNNLLQKVLTLVPLTAAGTEVFVPTMNPFLSHSYDDMEETLTHMKSLKLKRYPWENVTDCCAEILVDAERLESTRAFKPEHLGYINRILRILLNSDSFCGIFKSTRRLRSLSRNFVCVTWMSYHKMIS